LLFADFAVCFYCSSVFYFSLRFSHSVEAQLLNSQRKNSLEIWGLGLGFYLFYTPYSGLAKALANGLLPGTLGPIKGTILLPVSAMATAVGMLGFITVMKWWKYAGRREFFGISVPFPRRLTFLSGVCMATIMGTTTLAFTFGGLSIVLVLVLLRGGTLIIAPVVDHIVGRRVRWFSWAAMFTSLLAVSVVLSDGASYTLTIAAIIDVAAYLTAYFFKLQFMSRLAKSDDNSETRRYFVEEQMVASPLLVLGLVVMAFIGAGDVMMGFRVGLTTFLTTPPAVYAGLVGLFYAALCVCTTLIFLDRRENTFCVPMHCGSSMLSGFTATALLALLLNQNSPSMSQMISACFIVVALGFLSPLHHFDRVVNKLANGLAKMRRLTNEGFIPRGRSNAPAGLIALTPSANTETPYSAFDQKLGNLPRLILFVCSGNTCRSPMAAAIANVEIAARFQVPFEALETVNVRALSAGVSAKVGSSLTPEAQEVLRSLNVPVGRHAARNLTAELANEAGVIFCMTSAHRQAVIDMLPSVAWKTYCLGAEGDIDDPIGKGIAAYLNCAMRIQELVRLRLKEFNPPLVFQT
jgi:protein-tyrosine-phosphatase